MTRFATLFGRLKSWFASLPLGVRLVLGLALLLHGCGLWWGMPSSTAWDNDGIAPRDFLPGLASTFTPGRYYTYPPLHLAILTVLTLPVTLIAVVRAGSTSVPVVLHEIIEPPYMTAMTMTARVVTLIMSLVIVASLAAIADEIAPRERERRASVSTFTALFATLNWTFSYYSHTSNLDVPYSCWAWLAVLALVRTIVRNEPRRLRHFAIFAAMAIATKDQAYAMFLLGAPLAILTWVARERAVVNIRTVVKEVVIAIVLGGVLILVLDGALFNPSGFRARVGFLTGSASKDFEIFSRDGRGRALAFVDSYLYFRRHYPPVVAGFVLLGLPVAILGARKRGGAIFVASLVPLFIALSFSICFNMVALRSEERFTLPQMLAASVFAGFGLDLLWNRIGVEKRWLRWSTRAICCAGLGLAAIECIRVDATLLAEPRYKTEAFLAANAKPGVDTIEVHGNTVYLPRFPPGPRVIRVGPTDPTRRNFIPRVEEVQAPYGDIELRKPRFIVVSGCWVWRYLDRDMLGSSGEVVPSSQRAAAEDEDATRFFRSLFKEELQYRLADFAHIELFEPTWIHSSLSCPTFTFVRK